MRRFVVIAVLFVCAVGRANSGVNINAEAVKRAVVFIYLAGPNGGANESAADATGFLVQVPTSDKPTKYYYVLITARHVFDPQWANCAQPDPDAVFLRINKLSFDSAHDATGVDYLKLLLVGAGKPLFAVSSDSSDVAAILLNPNVISPEKYQINMISISDFGTTDELKRLSVGDDLVTAGLMPMFTGSKRNYPIFKFGKISDIPDETVPISCDSHQPPRQANEWLIASNSFPGSSGSPIFFVPAGANGITVGGGRSFLAGLQSIAYGNADVAGMTPADEIFDTIQSMNLPNVDLYRGSPQN